MSTLSTPKKRSPHTHIDTSYNYNSPTLKKAMKPILQDIAPSPFKYYPILSSHHLKLEPYCDMCWGMKSNNQGAFDLHLLSSHNYACPNEQCSLQFVEQKHLQKHIPICKASMLLMSPRKIREKRCNKNLINFPLEMQENKEKACISIQQQVMKSEIVWITCYPNNKYCANILKGCNQISCNDRKYCDPKNNTPIPTHKCYFRPSKNKGRKRKYDNNINTPIGKNKNKGIKRKYDNNNNNDIKRRRIESISQKEKDICSM
eukprot:399870_1